MSDPRRGWPVEFKTLEWSPSGPYRNRVEALLRTEDDWVRLNDRERPIGVPSLPPVDWERSSLVLVSLEDNTSGAREMEIVGVSLDGREILVDIQVREAQGVAPGSPYHLIEVPASEADRVVVREVPIENGDTEQPGPRNTTWGRLKSKFGS